MFQSRRFENTGDKEGVSGKGGRTGGKNNFSGTLGYLARDEAPLKKRVEFNIDGELDTIYAELVTFVEGAHSNVLIFDLHMLFHAIGMKGNQPVVIYSRLIHDIIAREISRWNRTREIAGKIDEILEPKIYSDIELKELTSGYVSREGNRIKIAKRGAAFLLYYIEQVASDTGYQWIDGKWQKYKKEYRFAQAKKKKKN